MKKTAKDTKVLRMTKNITPKNEIIKLLKNNVVILKERRKDFIRNLGLFKRFGLLGSREHKLTEKSILDIEQDAWIINEAIRWLKQTRMEKTRTLKFKHKGQRG